MKVKIQRNQIHHFKEGEKDILHFGVQFPEYPNLPTYGIRVEFPVDKQKVIDAIKTKAQEAKAQMLRDEAIRDLLGSDILEFDMEV